MACRSGCRTKDHDSYAACLRASRMGVASTINSSNQWMFDQTKSDLSAYQRARAEGIQPEGTTTKRVDEALAATKMLGRPYDGNTDPPAHMITTKSAAKFTNWKE